jgi:hypothetical protein
MARSIVDISNSDILENVQPRVKTVVTFHVIEDGGKFKVASGASVPEGFDQTRSVDHIP